MSRRGGTTRQRNGGQAGKWVWGTAPIFFENQGSMQVKIFAIQIPGGDPVNEELNQFLRSKKILSVENQLIQNGQGAYWCFYVKYLDEPGDREKTKVDYRQVLDEVTFKRFARLRDIRKQISLEEAVPAYVIFTDEELAALAKIETLTIASMKTVKGIGEKKVEKYGAMFTEKQSDEKS